MTRTQNQDGTYTYTQIDTNEYDANSSLTVTEDLYFYAIWDPVAFVIEFLLDGGITSFEGSMANQSFAYSSENTTVTLNPNQFIVYGQRFQHWRREDTGDTIGDQGTLTIELTGEEGEKVTIRLIACWVDCTHTSVEKKEVVVVYNEATNVSIITRECKCRGFTETITLTGETGADKVYDEDPHNATYKYEASPSNEPAEDYWKDITILYVGTSYANEAWNSTDAPVNAGEYTAKIVLNGTAIEVNADVLKAEQKAPTTAPDYSVQEDPSTTGDIKNNLIVVTNHLENEEGSKLEYCLFWYVGGVVTSYTDTEGKPIWIDQTNGLQWTLSASYTNYYVEVRYKGTDNYLPSNGTKGSKIFIQGINIQLNLKEGFGVDVSWVAGDQSGIIVTVAPEEKWYLYDVELDPVGGETLGEGIITYSPFSYQDGKAQMIINVSNYQGALVVINITFSGAKYKPTVESHTVKDQVFDKLPAGDANVTISRDSAYTAFFKVEHYDQDTYQNPAILFSTTLPIGTTVIMKDMEDNSYWFYTVPSDSQVNQISLTDFKRGDSKYAIGTTGVFQLQFIVDFSRCAETLAKNTSLTLSFVADKKVTDDAIKERIPEMPNAGNSISTVTLAGIPAFSITVNGSNEGNSLIIDYQYAKVDQDSIGTSKWDSQYGVLVVKPTNVSDLPADARLEVRIGESSQIYSLKNGQFIVVLPAGSGEATLTLISDMFPLTKGTYAFDLQLCSADTKEGVVTGKQIDNREPVVWTFINSGRPKIALDAKLEKYDGNSDSKENVLTYYWNAENQLVVTPVCFSVMVDNLPDGYKVKYTLYTKQGSAYVSASVTGEVTLGENNVLELGSLSNTLTSNPESISLELRFEVEDANGVKVEYVQSVSLYFALLLKQE